MATTPKPALSGQLPNDKTHNGLLEWTQQLAEADRDDRLFAFVVFDVPTVKRHVDDGSESPTVRAMHIEPIGWLADAPKELVSAMTRLGVERSGGEPLPGMDDTDDGQATEVYVTSPDDDEARGAKLQRAALAAVPSPFSESAAE